MRDYTKYSFFIAALAVVSLLGISFIPPFSIGGINFRRANIISEIYQFDDKRADREIEISEEDLAFIDEHEDDFEDKVETPDGDGHSESWDLGSGSSVVDHRIAPEEWSEGDPVIKIENYAEEDERSIEDFCALLGEATESRIVRIGFLGDSYIEGDIITADVRQQLQERYGGGGVGFIPFDSPLAANKPTVKHTFGGWKNHELIYKRNAPEELQDRFYISGTVSEPSEGAWTKYETTRFRKNLSSVSTARLIFTNTMESKITMVINDTIERQFTPPISDLPQLINVSGARIADLKVTVDNPEGFYGYGTIMEGTRGVALDNYSIRGNSGLALFGTNGAVNRQINQSLGYDLIVLQYGLNIMEAEVTGYAGYGDQMRRLINYMKSCFPGAAIVVLGVGDRSMQEDGEFVTMPAVPGMIRAQRNAARETGVAFWSIYDVMAHYGGMTGFVEKGWAAKDYTHLSYGGGRKIAEEFVKALEYVKRHSEVRLTEEDRRRLTQPVESISTFESVDVESLRPADTMIIEKLALPDSLKPKPVADSTIRELQRLLEADGESVDSVNIERSDDHRQQEEGEQSRRHSPELEGGQSAEQSRKEDRRAGRDDRRRPTDEHHGAEEDGFGTMGDIGLFYSDEDGSVVGGRDA